MKKTLSLLLLVFMSMCIYAQTEENIKELIALGDYQAVIDNYANKDLDAYSIISLYNIGIAYLMAEDYNSCIKFMDLSIAKDSTKSAPYYTKGTCYLLQERFEGAIPFFQKVIEIETDSIALHLTYSGLGMAHYDLGLYDSSIQFHKKAISYNKTIPDTYIAISQTYIEQNKYDKGLEILYKGKQNASEEFESFSSIFNYIRLIERLKDDYDKAEKTIPQH